MTEQTPVAPKPRFWETLGRVAGVLLRLLVVLVVGTLVGVGLYLGVPALYRGLVEPVERNTADLVALRQRMERDQSQSAADVAALQDQVAALEERLDQLGSTVEVQQSSLAADQSTLAALEPRIETVETSLEDAGKAIATLKTDLQKAARDLASQDTSLESQEAILDELDKALDELGAQVTSIGGGLDPLSGRLALLQVAQGLLRTRVLLQEDNIGDARNALALALTHIQQLRATSITFADPAVDIETRLIALDELVADRSFRALPSLDALWVDVMDLASYQPATLPEATTTLTGSLTSTLPITVTGVPTVTVAPTVALTTTETLTPTTP